MTVRSAWGTKRKVRAPAGWARAGRASAAAPAPFSRSRRSIVVFGSGRALALRPGASEALSAARRKICRTGYGFLMAEPALGAPSGSDLAGRAWAEVWG